MQKKENIIWGLVLIALGLILGLKSLGIANINIFFKGWWTFFLIIPSFIGLFKEEDKTGNLIILLIGVVLLLGSWNIISFKIVWKILLPAILVILGLSCLFKGIIGHGFSKPTENFKSDSNDTLKYQAIFSSQKVAVEKLKEAELIAVFGDLKLDLSKVNLEKDIILTTTSLFGNISIILPDNVNIMINSMDIIGGVTDKSKKSTNAQATIYLNANCVFGGVDLK